MRAHRHEGGSQNLVVTGRKASGARARAGGRGFQFEVQPTQGGIPIGRLCGVRFLYATWWVGCTTTTGSDVACVGRAAARRRRARLIYDFEYIDVNEDSAVDASQISSREAGLHK